MSLFPRLNTAFRALEAKLSDDKVSNRLDAFGDTLTINNVLELPPVQNTDKMCIKEKEYHC